MRNKVGCEGGGENAAKPDSKIGAVVGLLRGMARPVRKLRTESRKVVHQEHLESGTFSALGRPANITPTLQENGSFPHSSTSHRVWMHMDDAIPHARARPKSLCCAVHAVQR
jgi:hypothetical protein